MTFLCWSIALLWIMFRGVKAFPIPSCTDDQYKRSLRNGSAVCVDCFVCPVGLGPSVECGTTISADTKTECKICKAGVSFSPLTNKEQCEPCSVCSEDQVSKPCTPTSDTVCEKRCISKENYYEKSSDDCQDCTWCCGDGSDIVIDECLKKGMPAEKSCTVHRKKLCKPPPTTGRPLTAFPTTLPPVTTRTIQPTVHARRTTEVNNWNTEITRINKPLNQSRYQRSNRTNSSSVQSPSITVALIGVAIGLVSLIIVAVLVFILHKKYGICSSFSKKSQGKFCTVIYTKKQSKEEEDSIIANYQESRLFDLFRANYKLKEKVCNKLDRENSFAKLARECGMDDDLVRKLEEHPGNEPTHEVFNSIEGSRPGFCFGDFANILKKIKRRDVLMCCVQELQPPIEIQVQLSN